MSQQIVHKMRGRRLSWLLAVPCLLREQVAEAQAVECMWQSGAEDQDVRALVTAEKSDLDLVLMQWWKPSWSMKCQVKPVVMRTRQTHK
mmetsp:Transcript_46350/g.107921  ORF Transcript_46350/g.107921 Transcript_46350/m.107921 type:complete len:89 (+) Transcript_46350:144-410(+)